MTSPLNADAVITRLADHLGVKTDAQLGTAMGVPRTTVTSWRTRNSVPFEECVAMAQRDGLSLEWLLTGRGPKLVMTILEYAGGPAEEQIGDGTYLQQDVAPRFNDFTLYHTFDILSKVEHQYGDRNPISADRKVELFRYLYNALTGEFNAIFHDLYVGNARIADPEERQKHYQEAMERLAIYLRQKPGEVVIRQPMPGVTAHPSPCGPPIGIRADRPSRCGFPVDEGPVS